MEPVPETSGTRNRFKPLLIVAFVGKLWIFGLQFVEFYFLTVVRRPSNRTIRLEAF